MQGCLPFHVKTCRSSTYFHSRVPGGGGDIPNPSSPKLYTTVPSKAHMVKKTQKMVTLQYQLLI